MKLSCDTFLPKSLALRHYNALGAGVKCFNREVYAKTFIRAWRCNLNVKTREFQKNIHFRTISSFQNRVSYSLRKGASKSACFLSEVQISERSVWEKLNRTSAFWPSVLRKNALPVASAAPAPLFLPPETLRECARFCVKTRTFRSAGQRVSMKKCFLCPKQIASQRKCLGRFSKKVSRMREIAFGPFFQSKVSCALGWCRPGPGRSQTKSLAKRKSWTQRKPPSVIKSRWAV